MVSIWAYTSKWASAESVPLTDDPIWIARSLVTEPIGPLSSKVIIMFPLVGSATYRHLSLTFGWHLLHIGQFHLFHVGMSTFVDTMALCLSRLFFNSSLIRIVLSVGAAIRNSVSNREIRKNEWSNGPIWCWTNLINMCVCVLYVWPTFSVF